MEEDCIAAYLSLGRDEESIYTRFLAMVNLQHYGCPTRLIDFTDSLYAAVSFGIEGDGMNVRFLV